MKVIKPRNGRILAYNPRNFDAEPGDYMINPDGNVFRLEASSSGPKRARGELYPRRVNPPGTRALNVGGEWRLVERHR